MNWQDYISQDEQVLLGKPCIKSTRISVELILELFSNGWTMNDVLTSYPTINETQVKAVFGYLKDYMGNE